MPRTADARALLGLDAIEAEQSAQVIVCDDRGSAEAVAQAWGELTTAWLGRKSTWHTAEWSVLAGRDVVVLANATHASRDRARRIAGVLVGHNCIVRVGLPDGTDGSTPEWWIRDKGKTVAKAYIGGLLEPASRGASDTQAPIRPKAAPSPAAGLSLDSDWLQKNEYFEVLGHEAGEVYLRWGGEISKTPLDRLASPAKLKTLAPPAWWTAKTGAEHISSKGDDVAGRIGWGLAQAARERGRMADYDLDGSIVGLPGDRILELETGHIRGRGRGDRVLRALTVEPAEGDPALWLTTLRAILDHIPDAEAVIAYLRRWFGVSLTTNCENESMLLLVGKPGCGKSTILDTWAAICGTYAETLPGAFVAGGQQNAVRHLVAGLRGARIVRVDELPDSGKWSATEDLNALVSGETLKADKKYGDAFQFRSVSHLMISANKRPRTDPNSGLFRRMRLLALRPMERRDEGMKTRLRDPAELGLILSWALSGLRDGGLAGHPIPASMTHEAIKYRDTEDVIGRFVDAACKRDDNAITPFDNLFREFERWVESEKMRPWTKQAFARALNDFDEFSEYKGTGGVRCRIGIKVAQVAEFEQESL